MSLITRNEEFLERSLEDEDYFGWPLTLINPLGEQQELTGQVRHINMMMDIDTGADVQQEQVSVALRLSSVTIGEPQKGWKVNTTDTNGNAYTYYVVEAMPDRTMGLVVLKLGRIS